MLKNIKEDIDKDLPKVGHLMDDTGEDIVNKLDQLFNNVASGLEKLFGEVEKPPED
jgi:hypothetical protein